MRPSNRPSKSRPEISEPANQLSVYSPASYIRSLWGKDLLEDCPFSDDELDELERLGEILVYVPARRSIRELCELFQFKSNVDFENDRLIRSVMTGEDQWFVASRQAIPELLYTSAHAAGRVYEDEGLKGMDVRRYVAFAATYRKIVGELPDKGYWTFLHSGSYDRSGISILGFDRNGVLNHHGWMKNFRAKFVGSRYVVLSPRIDRSQEALKLTRAYRGRNGIDGLESTSD